MAKQSPVLAVDIGTTTIELSCFIPPDHDVSEDGFQPPENELFHEHFSNPQRRYGADLLSRANNAIRFDLSETMREMVRCAIFRAVTSHRINWQELSLIILSGNTLMLHLFWGWNVSGMTTAPFTADKLTLHRELWDSVPVISMPCIGAFVGGDILSGLYALDIHDRTKNTLFVDLGTNGEIILSHSGRLLASSVAAGPAFEGGNISIGTFARPGAIDSVTIRRRFCRIHTIDGLLPPRGICGSGLIEAVYELFQDHIIDAHGSFIADNDRADGFPLFAPGRSEPLSLSQNDIRSLQMGKAAVRAGMETLLSASGIPETAVDTLYLAGSFGEHLDIKKASGIGLIPKTLLPRTKLAGNTSLLGAIRLGCHPTETDTLSAIAKEATLLSLADCDAFKSAYIRQMNLAP